MRDLGDVQQRLEAALELDKGAVLLQGADDSDGVLFAGDDVGAGEVAYR